MKLLAKLGYEHERDVVELGSDISAHVSVERRAQTAASLLKRWLGGTLHQGISNDHRFNRRASRSRGLDQTKPGRFNMTTDGGF